MTDTATTPPTPPFIPDGKVVIIPAETWIAGIDELSSTWHHAGFVAKRELGNPPIVDMPLTFRRFAEVNAARCGSWHADGVPWTGADYGNEMGGECGEAQNVIKKLRRIETGVARGQTGTVSELLDQLGEELADTIICAHLVALHYGVNVEAALVRKFNATSRKHGLTELLPEHDQAGA